MNKFTHVNTQGKAAMVDVSGKPRQRRRARASGRIRLAPATVELIRQNQVKKGEVLAIAEFAGIQAAKATGGLIPLCHPLTLDCVEVRAELAENGVAVESAVTCHGRTGVEMEALTAVSVALLTVYDMCKAVDKSMRLGEIKLLEKVKEDA